VFKIVNNVHLFSFLCLLHLCCGLKQGDVAKRNVGLEYLHVEMDRELDLKPARIDCFVSVYSVHGYKGQYFFYFLLFFK